ncbi:hypothetical protein OY671_007282 [Metschnikowia pulcherrima]|nr:hypothetical protein OY671_007282 [Metschnikowia pulcherrima]
METKPVTVSLEELEQGLSFSTLESAFGDDSLGIIVVSRLPASFHNLRRKVLHSVSALASLPAEEIAKLEVPEAMWLIGWSRGKERLSESGEPDYNKGSYYVNCAFHKDAKLEGPPAEMAKRFPNLQTYTHANVWPDKHLPGLESFEADCKQLCNLIIDVAAQVARNCDTYISTKNSSYEPSFLQKMVQNSTCTKARLLHYYPIDNKTVASQDSWCGEHTDHSCLTGLTSALYIDETDFSENDTQDVNKAQATEKNSGLYIRDRRGESVKVSIPEDCLAFQSGAALEEISGSFRAVPHYVRGSTAPHVARNTLAVFCQPDLDEKVNKSENFAQFSERILKQNHEK